jgi:gliding motility-associated-like protein
MKKITLVFLMLFLSFSGYSQESFENGIPATWASFIRGSGSFVWETIGSPAGECDGSMVASVNIRQSIGNGNTAEKWLVSNQLFIPSNGDLRFCVRTNLSADNMTKMHVKISTSSQTDVATFEEKQTFTELQVPTSEYTQAVISLPEYAGQNVYIAFVVEYTQENGINGDRWYLDNVRITSQCNRPTNPSAPSASLSMTSALLQWTGTAPQYQVEVFQFPNTSLGVFTVTGNSVNTSALGLTLTQGTQYFFQVRSVCGVGATSTWTDPVTFTTVFAGQNCNGAIGVTALPYTTTNNTLNFADLIDGSPGSTCGITGNYLNGNDAFYKYTADFNGVIKITMTPSGNNSGIFVYNSCANVGVSCIAGAANTGSAPRVIELPVVSGETYYMVISTSGTPQTVGYTLTIEKVNCPPPNNLTALVGPTFANLTWGNPAGATSWEYAVQNAGALVPTGAGVQSNTNASVNVTTTINGIPLDPTSNYQYYVRVNCGDGTFSAWSGPHLFSTTQIPGTLDYTEGFEGTVGWTLVNGTQTNKWAVGTAVNNGGTRSLYISNNNGTANAYTITAASVVQAYRDIEMPTTLDELLLTFDWRSNGQGTGTTFNDYFRVWIVPSNFTPVAGTQITAANSGGIQVGGHFNNNNTFTTGNFVVPMNAFAGQIVRLVFEWRNDASGGAQFPAAIDNINFSVITCPSPTNLVASNPLPNSATFTWNAPNSVNPSYDYYISDQNTPPTDATVPTDNVAGTTVTVGGLAQSTIYYLWIRSNCAASGASFWVGPVSIATTQIPATLDYTDGFEDVSVWFLNNGTQTNKWIVGNATNNGGARSLYISNNNADNSYTLNSLSVVHAFRDIEIPAGTDQIKLAFDWRAMGEGFTGTPVDYFRAWLVPVTYHPVAGTLMTVANSGGVQLGANLNNSANYTNQMYTIPVADYAGQVMRLVFEWRNSASGGTQPPAAIDNVNISVVNCPTPSAVAIGAIGQDEATASWTPPQFSTPSFDYYYSDNNTAPTSGTAPTGNVTVAQVVLTPLEPSTIYYFWVRSNCVTSTSDWLGPYSFTTTQIPAPMNFIEDFEGTINWSLVSGTQTNQWIVGTATNNGGARSMYISNNNADNAYTITATTTAHAYRDIQMPGNLEEIGVSFDWRARGDGFTTTFFDYLRVWLVPSTYTPTPGTLITAGASGGIQLGGSYNNNGSYITQNFVLPATAYSGQIMRLIFEWRNDNGGGTQPPAAIDNINVKIITCPAPSNLVTSSPTAVGATVGWTGPNAATSYDYYVSATNTAPNATTEPTGNATGNSTIIEGLDPTTTYYVWVRSNCGDVNGVSFWTGPVSFTTTQIPAQLNFSENFDGTINWSFNNGTQTNKWIVGTATSASPTRSLYISNNNSANSYSTGNGSVVQAYRDIQMPAGMNEVTFSFDWKGVGEGFTTTNYDYFRVWFVPASFTPIAGTQIDATSGGFQVGGNFNNRTAFGNQSYVLPMAAYAGQIMRLVFEWRNDGGGGTQPPAAIDNINMNLITCPSPVNLLATMTPGEAQVNLSWQPTGTETQWEIIIQTMNGAVPTATSTGQIVNSPNFTYIAQADTFYEFYVRAICSDSDKSFWSGPQQFSIFVPPGCAAVDVVGVGIDIQDSRIVVCPDSLDEAINLEADFYGIAATSSYAVESITYAPPFPFLGGTQMPITSDDDWTASFTLPFKFCFFGQSYSHCQVGDNGVIGFGRPFTNTYGDFCEWDLDDLQIPNPAFPIKNAIYGIYQDMYTTNNPGPNSQINYQVLGTYPCRALVVNFNEVPAFGSSCTAANYRTTSQIVLYEISNIIEVYVDKRIPCTSWNEGQGVIGIQNASGSAAYVPPGRNNGPWTATQEAWRFVPNGPSDVDFQWQMDGEFFSYDQAISISLTPEQQQQLEQDRTLTVQMTATATYATCTPGEDVEANQTIDIVYVLEFPEGIAQDLSSCSATGSAVFDLTQNNANILQDLDASLYTFSYFLTLEDAQLNQNAIENSTAFEGVDGQEIFVRIGDVYNRCFTTQSFFLHFGDNVQTPVVQFSYDPAVVCISNNSGPLAPRLADGFTMGGQFTAPEGLSINLTTGVIDLASSIEGTYLVTYNFTAVGCITNGTHTFTIQLVLANTPITEFSYDKGEYCIAGPNPILSTEPGFDTTGSFTVDPEVGLTIDATTGAIDLATSTAGVYVIKYRVDSETEDCVFNAEYSVTITITDTIDPSFEEIQSVYCIGSITTALPQPNNGIAGTWSPATIDTSVAVVDAPYVFTPDADQCANVFTLLVTVTDEIVPTFDSLVKNYCLNAIVDALPNSDNGIIGIWNPSTIDTSALGTTTYTFTPNANQCASVTTVVITISTQIVPVFTQIDPICVGATAPEFPTTSTNGIVGTWNASIDTASAGTIRYVFTPNGDVCATQATMDIVVVARPIIDLLTDQYVCEGAAGYVLPTLTNGNYYLLPGGQGDTVAVGTVISTTQTLYIFAPGTLTDCASEASFTVHSISVDADQSEDVIECYRYYLPELSNGNAYYTGPGRTGTQLFAGEAVQATQTVYIYSGTPEGCYDETSFLVTIEACMIQKGISPNNDGSNDFFDLSAFQVRHLSIFNRYGSKVYSKANYSTEWFGQTDKGDKLPDGTYYYVIELNNSKTETGWIYINSER